MSINKYFTELVTIKRKTRSKVGGVMKEVLQDVVTLKVGIDKTTTAYSYQQDKETFIFTDIIFAPISTDVLEDDVIDYDGRLYDVVSVVNPMRRQHHLEILVNFRK